jgi:hypothetical protein
MLPLSRPSMSRGLCDSSVYRVYEIGDCSLPYLFHYVWKKENEVVPFDIHLRCWYAINIYFYYEADKKDFAVSFILKVKVVNK